MTTIELLQTIGRSLRYDLHIDCIKTEVLETSPETGHYDLFKWVADLRPHLRILPNAWPLTGYIIVSILRDTIYCVWMHTMDSPEWHGPVPQKHIVAPLADPAAMVAVAEFCQQTIGTRV